jgi:hypothetical protein
MNPTPRRHDAATDHSLLGHRLLDKPDRLVGNLADSPPTAVPRAVTTAHDNPSLQQRSAHGIPAEPELHPDLPQQPTVGIQPLGQVHVRRTQSARAPYSCPLRVQQVPEPRQADAVSLSHLGCRRTSFVDLDDLSNHRSTKSFRQRVWLPVTRRGRLLRGALRRPHAHP